MWSDEDGTDTASADTQRWEEVSGCWTVKDHDEGRSKCKTVTAAENFMVFVTNEWEASSLYSEDYYSARVQPMSLASWFSS